VHGVTAEPGGNAAIRQKLLEEGVDMAFPVHSDPDLHLLARDHDDQPARDIYVHGKVDKSRDYLEGVQTNEVQPAFVVANSDGEVTRFWSWKSLFDGDELEQKLNDTETIAAETSNKELDPGLVPVSIKGIGASGKNQDDKTWIVNIRPDMDDLLPAILEDRPVKITEVKTIAEVFDDHHKSLDRQGLATHEAPGGGLSADLQAEVNSAQVVFFEEVGCPFCKEAAEALDKASIPFKRVNIRSFKPSLKAATGKTSAPSVWVKGTYIGGCNDGTQDWHGVLPMLKKRKLQEMLA